MRGEHALKLFGLNNLAIEADLRRVANEHKIDIGRRAEKAADVEQAYYPQFTERLRAEGHALRHLLLP
jgi:hypothetical protein